MSKKKLVLAGVALLVLSVIAVGVVFSVNYLSRPTWRWGVGDAFFRFDGRAVFAEMAAEPAHSIYGSIVHIWVYRDDQGNIAEVLITGHAASKVCVRASIQLYETAIRLDVGEHDLLGAGIGRFLGADPDELDALRQEPPVREYEELLLEIFLKRLRGEDTTKLEEQIAKLEQDTVVRQFLRPERLEDLVTVMRRLQAETGLIKVAELDISIAEATQAEVERQVRLAQQLTGRGVSVVQLGHLGGPEHAVFLPFYYTAATQADGPLPYLIIELDARELSIPRSVLAAHLDAVLAEMRAEAERRREFAQKRLEEAEDLKRSLERDIQTGRRSEDELITITHTIDWDTLRVIPLPEPKQMRLGDYLRDVLPGIIESAQEQIKAAEHFLAEINKAAEPGGRLAELNQAIIIDSFLRDWDLAFLDEAQAKAYDDWRRDQRNRVWSTIDRVLRQSGVNPQLIKQEGVVFHVRIQGNKILITPYFISDGELLMVIGSRDGVVRYVNSWGLRELVIRPKEDLPTEVRTLLEQGREESWKQARDLLVAPLLSEAISLLEKGEVEAAQSKLAEALLLYPIGVAEWLVKQYRIRQVDTTQQFQTAQDDYRRLGPDIAFLEAFWEGSSYLVIERYAEAIELFLKAHQLRPSIPDPVIRIAQGYYWSGDEAQGDQWFRKAEQLDREFVRRFAEAWGRREVIYSKAFQDVKARIDALPPEALREIEVIKHINTGDAHFQKHEHVQALWEYMDALRLNTKFNEPYQRIIDIYWELGMYQRALEAAFLRLSDPVFGLELQAKPLRISSPNLKWEMLSSTAHEKVEELAVNREGSILTILVNGEPVLKLESPREEEIAHLEQFLGTLTAERISPIGKTTAERLLNTEIPPFPDQKVWAERIFFSEGVGDLMLKAMVYGGVAPSFLTDSKVNIIAAHVSEAMAFLGTRIDRIWETRDIVTRVEYPKDQGERTALREAISQYYADTGREVVSVKVFPDIETFSLYAPRSRWDVLRRRITGDPAPGPYTTVTLPRGLPIELVAGLVKGSFVRNLSPTEVQALLADAGALTKLSAWQSVGTSGLCLKVGDLILVANSEGLIPLSKAVQQVLERYGTELEQQDYNPAKVILNQQQWQTLVDELLDPLLERVGYQVTWVENRPSIRLDLAPGEHFFLDVPVEPILRGVLWMTLKGNPVVWVAESSDSLRAKEALMRARVNLEKSLTVIVSCPTKLWEAEATREVWIQEIKKLEARIKELGLPIKIVDRSGWPGDEAVAEVQRWLQQGEAQVLGFLHVPEANAFEVGLGGRLDEDKIRAAGPSTVEESFKAIVGCSPLLYGLNDVFIESNLTLLTLTIGEEFDPGKLSLLIERWGELRARGKKEATVQELFPDREWGKMGKAEPSAEHKALS